MFPIRDHNPSLHTPYVTYALLAANVIIFLAYYPMLSADEFRLAAFFNEWATIPAEVSTGQNYHTILTSMFLHGGWMHLVGNMLFLWIFGDNMEDAFGHVGFLVFYLASGAAADYAHVLSDPTSITPTVGASGAIAGVMGGYLLLYPKARVDVILILFVIIRRFALPAWTVLGLWFAFQIFNGVTADLTAGGVAYWAHAGGFIIGFLFTLPLWLRRGGKDFWRQNDGHPPHPPTGYPERMSSIPIVRRR